MLGANSCGTTRKLICAEVKSYEYPPMVLYEYSYQFNRCRVYCYDFNTAKTLPANRCKELNINSSEARGFDFDISKCDGIAGFKHSNWALNIVPTIKAIDKIKKDNCKNK